MNKEALFKEKYVKTSISRCNSFITSYIDGSVVYGESEERNSVLREFKDGKMKVGSADLLPVSQRLKLGINEFILRLKFGIIYFV